MEWRGERGGRAAITPINSDFIPARCGEPAPSLDTGTANFLSAAPGILVVDDDPMLLAMLRIALQRPGFAVWTADSGRAALELFRQYQHQISLVLLDVRMPDLDGPQTLAELQRLRPGLTCCFMSGHTGTYTAQDLRARGALYLFEKPFRLEEITSVLWRLAQESPKQAV